MTMPYIIETSTTRYHSAFGREVPHLTHTAVATLEEMRQKAFGAIDRASKMDRDMNSDEQRADRGFRLVVRFDLDEGGTVGPLPDGTVIEVRQLQWIDLARLCEMDCGDLCAGPNEDVLAVFNGAHA